MTDRPAEPVCLVMRCSTFLLLFALAPAVAAQDSTIRVVGRVRAHAGPLEGAQVSIFDDTSTTSHAHVARSATSGLFAIAGLTVGRHRLVVRRIGYRVAMRVIEVRSDSRDSIDVELYLTFERTHDDSVTAAILRADYQRRLAAARARPRHWTCERRRAVVHQHAEEWAWLANATADDIRDGKRNPWGLSADSARFVSTFRPIVDAAECARIGRALDKQEGLLSDSLTVFRMGNVYLLPTGEGGGLVLDLKGKIITTFVIPD